MGPQSNCVFGESSSNFAKKFFQKKIETLTPKSKMIQDSVGNYQS